MNLRARWRELALVCLAAGALAAQYPGQTPGQYPGQSPGQYPDQTGTSLPGLPGRKSKQSAGKKPGKDEILLPYTGIIGKIEPESIVINAEDTRIITFKTSTITKYLKDEKEMPRTDLKVGDTIFIESRKDDEGYFYAVNVKWRKSAPEDSVARPVPQEEPAKDAKPSAPRSGVVLVPTRITGADGEGPPKLQRGKPAPRAPQPEDDEEPSQPVTIVATTGASEAVEDKDEAFIARAREVSEQFTGSLPNFICRQMTTRYDTGSRPVNWRARDIVTASLIYDQGKESYQDISINGKKTKKSMEESGGTWSTGEFGTTLRDILHPSTDAKFYNPRSSTTSNRQAMKYDFEVEQATSHWKTIIAGQTIFPAYKGSIWFDKATARVLRIEMQAREIPEEFPLDSIEWTVDYAFVRIGTTNEYLVPVHAENLGCWRGTSRCNKNALDFRNYRRFTGESQILQTDSTITFEGDEKTTPPPVQKP